MVGLDGFDPAVGERLAAEGRLPHWSRLRGDSFRAELAPGRERYTGLSWEQFSSGRSPEETQRWSAVDVDAGRYWAEQPDTALTPFTHGLHERTGARAVVFDAPYFDLDLTPSTRGVVAWGAHDPGVRRGSRPASLLERLDAEVGPYPAPELIYAFVWPYPEQTAEMGRAMVASVERRGEMARRVFGDLCPDWDLAIHVISEYHSVAEALWHGWDDGHALHSHPSADAAREGLVAVYEAADRLLGRVFDDFPEADVLAFTPHGMGPNTADAAAMVLLPELLYRADTGRTAFHADPCWPVDGSAPPDPGRDWSQTLWGRLDIHVSRTQRLKRRLWGLPPDTPSGLDWMPTSGFRRVWPYFDAYAVPSFYDGRVRVNLAGREARGRVRATDYERTLRRVATLLGECVDPATGAPLDVELEFREGDPRLRHPTDADLLVRFRSPVHAFDHPRLGRIGPSPCRRPGGHTGGPGAAWYRPADGGKGELGTFPALEVSAGVRGLMGDDEAAGGLADALRAAARRRSSVL